MVKALGFSPKDNSIGIFTKKYNSYSIEVDFENSKINFGKKVKCDSKTTQNFSQEENWVVLECVDRLLEKGYDPEDLILEKVYPTGHGTSGRLDILVLKNKKAFLMIECKTWGKEFEKELKSLNKSGGQLFTYFQQDTNAEYLMLYTSKIEKNKAEFINKIINIEDSYRETSNVKDFFDRWNKITKPNGIFENWVDCYDFESKSLTIEQLKPITEEDSSFIFHRFSEILRHNVVSDKPNAFNKIFTLFLCKIIDEQRKSSEELHFQWIEGKDDNISFQKRLTDLYRKGMKELLSKTVTDLSEKEFNDKFGMLKEEVREQILEEITKLRLQKNNEFAIKEVFDNETFEENAKVLKEVVELLQTYRFRYNKKQQYLSNFFELLLTTGLKQESGQFFTAVPVARFICKSIPLTKIIKNKLNENNSGDLLPNVIDYAAGSGHFLIESMDEIQQIIDNIKESDYSEKIKKQILTWKNNEFIWAHEYIYGIEQDYRLVKTAKVGCYLNGDGIANVIIGDGLDNFKKSKSYTGKLKHNDKNFPQDNKQFDVIISNPPYSVPGFKGNFKDRELANKDFDLYKGLTEQSSEIECLFIERSKQLLNEGGVAGIILPVTFLSNLGNYSKTRGILLKYFKIKSMVGLGKGTFMATNTETVTLFLERRSDYDWKNIENSINQFCEDFKDITVDNFENIFSKYVNFNFPEISFEDYLSIFKRNPTEAILNSNFFKSYKKTIRHKSSEELLNKIINTEKEKLLYYILTYGQKIVLVDSGERKIEKNFLGYEFSNRRGTEGIHPIKKGKTIDECTKLFDSNSYNNGEKVSTYIYDAFEDKFDREIDEELKNHISRINLIDMITFNRPEFDKIISINPSRKISIDTKWDLIKLENNIEFKSKSKRAASYGNDNGKYPFYTSSKILNKYVDRYDYEDENIIIGDGGNSSIFIDNKFSASDHNFIFSSNNVELLNQYIFNFFNVNFNHIQFGLTGQGLRNISKTYLQNLEIPIPPKKIQNDIIREIRALEEEEENSKEKISILNNKIELNLKNIRSEYINLSDLVEFKNGLNFDKKSNGELVKIVGVKDFQEHFSPNLDELEETEISGELAENYELNCNDILVVRSNGSANLVGRFLYVDNLFEKTSFSGFTIRLRLLNNNYNSKFLCYYLKTNEIRNKLFNESKGSNIKSLNQTLLSNLKIPNLSLKEQEEILKKLKEIEKQVDDLKNKIKFIPKLKEKVLRKFL